jgi:hypothetical protein
MKRQPKNKKPYRKPRLRVYGDIRTLTAAKRGRLSDGRGKPATRASGFPA